MHFSLNAKTKLPNLKIGSIFSLLINEEFQKNTSITINIENIDKWVVPLYKANLNPVVIASILQKIGQVDPKNANNLIFKIAVENDKVLVNCDDSFDFKPYL